MRTTASFVLGTGLRAVRKGAGALNSWIWLALAATVGFAIQRLALLVSPNRSIKGSFGHIVSWLKTIHHLTGQQFLCQAFNI
jgi:hypothetical protein